MRLVKATLSDSYQVHKTFIEFLLDYKLPIPSEEKVYAMWAERLTCPEYRYALIMHSRKVVGMVWGRELKGEAEKTFLVEGRYLRRAYRGKVKFTRELVVAGKEVTKDFTRILVLLPRNPSKISVKYKIVGTLVEQT